MERLSPILGKALLRPYGDVELRHEEEIDPSLSKARGIWAATIILFYSLLLILQCRCRLISALSPSTHSRRFGDVDYNAESRSGTGSLAHGTEYAFRELAAQT